MSNVDADEPAAEEEEERTCVCVCGEGSLRQRGRV